jgi:hypothetical protein
MGYLSDALSELGDNDFTDFSQNRLVALINDAMWAVCAKEPWNFLEKTSSPVWTLAGGETPSSGFPTDHSKTTSLVIPGVGRIRPERRETIVQRNHSSMTNVGAPKNYYFFGNVMHLFPPPDNTYTGILDYISAPAALVLSTNEDPPVPDRHRRVITLRALISGYRMDDDPEALSITKDEYTERYADMREDCLRSHYDEPDRILVTDWDDYD